MVYKNGELLVAMYHNNKFKAGEVVKVVCKVPAWNDYCLEADRDIGGHGGCNIPLELRTDGRNRWNVETRDIDLYFKRIKTNEK